MPQANEHLSQVYFNIGGDTPPESMWRVIREIVVDTSIYLPDMFVIQLDDPGLSWIDSSVLEIGKSTEISGKAAGENNATALMKGEIVAIEPELTEDIGTTIAIRGYDKSHRLHRGKKSRVFQQATDSDIVKKIAQESGLDIEVETTGVVYDHVFQHDQTDMEFVHDRARRAGYLSYVENGKLFFRKASVQTPTAVLEWGKNLVDYRARFTSAGQATSSEVYGWDVKQKKAVIGKKNSPTDTPTVAGVNHGGDLAKKAFGITAIEVINDRTVINQGEADLLAQSILNEKCQAFFQAEGTCHGNPAVRAGKQVEIKGIGQRFSGRYLVTRAVHHYDITGYTTQFEISGYRSNTLSELLAAKDIGNLYGVVVGIVTNVNDPDNLARVKVKLPTISEQLESNWARLVTPMAGPNRGIEFIPEVNDEVLVAFEYNDINKPYVIGSLWNGVDKPPETTDKIVSSDGKVQKRIIRSRSGHVITLDDTQSAEQISIVDKAGQKVVLDCASGKEKIEVIDKTGKSRIVMDAAKQSLSIESALDLTIKANGKIQIDGQTGVMINTAGGNLDLKSNAQTSIKGMQTSVQGTGTAELKSSGVVKVQGSLIQLN